VVGVIHRGLSVLEKYRYRVKQMKTLQEIQEILRQNKNNFFEKYHLTKIGIFGSYVKNRQTIDSDLDILVEFDPRFQFGLLTFCELENYLSALIGIKVDLVMGDCLKPKIGQQILSEVIYL
jgi:uncharacterized protein